MGVHPASLFGPHAGDVTEARRDLWQWAEPVIADCAADHYDRLMPTRLASTILAKKHCRLWQSIIHDQRAAVPQARDELHRTAEKFGLKPETTDDVNTAVLEELVDVVLARYRGSHRSAKVFSMILMSATPHLEAARALA